MKVFHVVDGGKDKIFPLYLDRDHLIEYLDNLPLNKPVTIGLLIDDSILNKFEYEVQK